jgi:hypothetical protein
MTESMINNNEERIETAFINRLNNKPEGLYEPEVLTDLPF